MLKSSVTASNPLMVCLHCSTLETDTDADKLAQNPMEICVDVFALNTSTNYVQFIFLFVSVLF